MLSKGFLASTIFYASIVHDDKIIDSYLNALDDVFKTISGCENGDISIDNLLKGSVCHSGFERLN